METPTDYTHVDRNLVQNSDRQDGRDNKQNMDKL